MTCRHKDFFVSYPIVAVYIVMLLVCFASFSIYGVTLSYAIALLIATFLFALFVTFSLSITGAEISYSYGIGAIGGSIPFGAIDQTAVLPNRFFTTWIYNPKGENVLVVALRDGRRIKLTSTEPRKIAQMIAARV